MYVCMYVCMYVMYVCFINLPTITTLLHLARLRHLASCIVVASPEFWALAHREGSWLALVRASFNWLGELTETSFQESDLQLRAPSWAEMIVQRPGSWKRLLKTSQQRALRCEAWEAARHTHNGLLARQLQAAGGLLVMSQLPAWDCHYFCGPCNRTFPTKQQWSVHAFKTHGRKTVGRGVLPRQQCQCCLRLFATNLKLANISPTVPTADVNSLHLVTPVPLSQGKGAVWIVRPRSAKHRFYRRHGPRSP